MRWYRRRLFGLIPGVRSARLVCGRGATTDEDRAPGPESAGSRLWVEVENLARVGDANPASEAKGGVGVY